MLLVLLYIEQRFIYHTMPSIMPMHHAAHFLPYYAVMTCYKTAIALLISQWLFVLKL